VLQDRLICSWRSLLLCFGLAPAIAAFGAPLITEFMADNETFLADADGDFPDWIEIHNPDAAPLSLRGYHLTDNPGNLNKWTFPAVTVPAGGYIVVFASNKNRTDPAAQLHTDFSLASEGEFLALVAPNGSTILSSFSPAFPEHFPNESFGYASNGELSYFTPATPGTPNATGRRMGPIFELVTKNPPPPAAGTTLLVTAKIRPANSPINAVRLYHRRMYNPEVVASMFDNGTNGDVTAGDGIWSAIIPSSAFVAGEMTRWRFVATDSTGTETREPSYRNALDSHQYYGTVTHDTGINSLLSVLHWFTSNPNGAGTSSGSRGSVYYQGEFYDNVFFNIHGQSSSSFPKKSYNIDFNRTQRFLWNTNAPRVADIDLLTNWADKSKVRHVLGWEVMRESGVAGHFAYTLRVEQNGSFFSTADFVEDADEIYLERAGLNPEGALYKVYSNVLNKDQGNTANSGVEKKTRKFENNADLQALIDGLDLTGTALQNYIYDNIDIPRCVNLLAANSVIRNIDMHSKNWYIYRDTGVSDEWAILPWDLDLSHGRVWNEANTYFDNALYIDGFVVTGTSIRLVSHLFNNPAIRTMILRRIRTLTDQFLQSTDTPIGERYYERRLSEQSALIDPPGIVPSDARQDFEKWGSWLQGGTRVGYTNTNPAVETMAEALGRWHNEYLPGRRNYIYNTQIVGKGGQIPLPQSGAPTFVYTPLLTAGAPVKALVPTNGDLGFTWIGIPTYEPFNTASWFTGVTGVGYERGTGYGPLIGLDMDTRMGNNTTVYLRVEFDVADPSVVERLELRMLYDDGFVAFLNGTILTAINSPASPQWNSAATALHEADPASFEVFDVTSKRSSLRAGKNILAIQGLNDSSGSSDMIFLPELYAGVVGQVVTTQPRLNFGTIEASPASGDQNQEFLQIVNPNSIAVDISKWRLTGGIDHTFAPGTVIPPSGTLYLTPDKTAFRARTVSPKRGESLFIQDGYTGRLSSLGETITLLDDAGVTNNMVTYQGQPSPQQQYLVVSELMYHPPGDGLGEFIEILNISTSATVNLTGVRFTQGVDFDFTGSAVTSLAPGERIVVVRDRTAFTNLYGPNVRIAGVFTNDTALSNGGELLTLVDGDGAVIQEFTFSDDPPWPIEADGNGRSLVLIAPETNPDPDIGTNWKASPAPGGSPGQADEVDDGFPDDPLGDANGNGHPDLIDYALGNNLGLSQMFPTFSWKTGPLGGAPVLELTSPVNLAATRATIEVHFSTNLTAWQDGAEHLNLISTQELGDGRALRTWHVKPPLSEESRLFMRLHVVAQ
jgi:hypothetical protein